MDKIKKEIAIKSAMASKLFYMGKCGTSFYPLSDSFREVRRYSTHYYLMRTSNPAVVAYVWKGEFYLTKTSEDKRQFLKITAAGG
jgi:hypothetical protein